jgi:enoyl-CoA hydratase
MRTDVSGLLQVDSDGSVAVVRIVRPEKRNALTREMLRRLPELMTASALNRATSIVLTGGPQCFSAGVDVHELGQGIADAEIDDEIAALTATIRSLSVPVIAAIEGSCFGAAVEIAVSCDARVAARNSDFRIPAAHLGVLYRPEGIRDLVSVVGRPTAMRLLVLGERLTGGQAAHAGLVSHLTEPGAALERALELAHLVDDSVPEAVNVTKQLVVASSSSDLDVSGFQERRRALLDSDERRAAVADIQDRLGGHRND